MYELVDGGREGWLDIRWNAAVVDIYISMVNDDNRIRTTLVMRNERLELDWIGSRDW